MYKCTINYTYVMLILCLNVAYPPLLATDISSIIIVAMANLSSSITYSQPQATSRLRNNLHPSGSILSQNVVGICSPI